VNKIASISARLGILLALLFCNLNAHAQTSVEENDTSEVDLPFPHGGEDPFNPVENTGGLSLDWPENINYNLVYDPETGQYIVQQTIGDTLQFRPSSLFTLDEFLDYDISGNLTEFWNQLQEEDDEANRAFAPKLEIDNELFEMLFGTNEIEIIPQGSAEISFGINSSNTENPRIPERQRRVTTFDFDQRIQLNITGKIGDKIELGTQYNTESLFDFENQMNIGYQGDEDNILKNIEAGNISLPLQGTLITGSQSLFGVKLETQWGRLYNSTIVSQQKGERRDIEVEGGAQTQEFNIRADDYEANRHYFLSQYFRNQYDTAMQSLPVPNSGVVINRIEVWVVNLQANTQDVRNVIAVTDLGEHQDYMSSNLNFHSLTNNSNTEPTTDFNHPPNNYNNDIFHDFVNNEQIMGYTEANTAIGAYRASNFTKFEQGVHYERVGNARKLTPSEFTYNSRLGFISLRQSLNNAEVLGVAYEYTLNGQTYQVGTLAQDGFTAPGALVLKMLKSSVTQLDLDNGDPSPLWEGMMKNVYSMQAFGLSQEDFRLDIWYNDPSTGVDLNYIPRAPLDGTLLLQLLGLDRFDINTMPNQDGVFDYVDNAATQGGTINSQNGRIFFPSVEPFGDNLRKEIEARVDDENLENALIQTLVFDPLYDSTKTAAQQIPSLNRYHIKGQFQSQSSSEIALNALNVPEGSVTVTAGGVRLIENQDYTVDYNLGRVRIINDGLLESGQTIRVSLESNSMFNIQTKTLLGTRFDYIASDDFTIGTTFLNLRERPLTQKVDIGDEPVNNTILGMDFTWQTESKLLTKFLDKLPFYSTTAESLIDLSAEGAYLIPGHSRAIGEQGNAYIDDFEGSQSTIDIRSVSRWFLASTPDNPDSYTLFPEHYEEASPKANYNRAALAWYTIDPVFYSGSGLQDGQVSNEVRHDHRMRQILEQEIFPNRDYQPGTPRNIPTFDLSYWPNERGPYNYVPAEGEPNLAYGLTEEGKLEEPETRWAGIQRALTTTDFEQANIEYIQFWVMDPFNDDSENFTGGDLYINLGNVSEDVLNDSQLEFENGLPSENNTEQETDTSALAVYPDPSIFNVVNAFDNSTGNYAMQDVGLDGLSSNDEREFFSDWLSSLEASGLTAEALAEIENDPSADDFKYFRDPESQAADLNIIDRYKQFSRYEGNSNTGSPNGYPITSTTIPNTEDINEDITLGTIESFYQYKISMRPSDLEISDVGTNYITDVFETESQSATTSEQRNIKWYQFKIPVKEFEDRVGSITDFRSIRFMRMYLKGWSQPVTIRFARMELIRGEWRKYEGSLAGAQEVEPEDPSATLFNLNAVNIEENGNREPVPYVTPPGIIREIDVAAVNARRLNEQSLSMEICGLADGDARGAYRNINYDMRMYKRLKMYFHAEPGVDGTELEDGDITGFIRLGSDFDNNYYEYEIPLAVTEWWTSNDDLIWPEQNQMDFEFSVLQNLKIERPDAWPVFQEYSNLDPATGIRTSVKGNPNLANVVMVMVGVRNPDKDIDGYPYEDDGLDKCAVVWANELRLSDFNEEGGWAAVARMNANLADLGNLNVAANMSTPGWGGLEERVQERQRETMKGIDANSTLQLGKLLPQKLGIQLPMYLGYSNQVSTPQFDPLSPDLEMADLDLPTARREKTESVNRLRSINFSSIRINPQSNSRGSGGSRDRNNRGVGDDSRVSGAKGGKDSKDMKSSSRGGMGMGGAMGGRGGAMGGRGGGSTSSGPLSFLKISNFTGNYSYNEQYRRDVNTEFELNIEHRGGLAYNWQNRPKNYKPFSKIGFLKNKELFKWLYDFNFYLAPKQISVNTQMDRMYQTSRVRNNTYDLLGAETPLLINTQVLKSWNWTRNYIFKYDLTSSLKFDYSAQANALVTEPAGIINKEDSLYEQYVDSVANSLRQAGQVTTYNHNVNGSYKLPFDKIPLCDFISGDARYQSSYRWDRAPFSQEYLGNTIQNSRNLSLNGQANFVKLYNRVPYLKEINNKRPKKKTNSNVSNERRDGFGNIEEEEEKKKREWNINPLEHILRFAMGIQNISGSFSRNEGIMLPGYSQQARYAGFNSDFTAPGLMFVLGHQNTDVFGNRTNDFAIYAAEQDWLLEEPNMNNMYTESFMETYNVRLNIEPIKHFKIELTANRSTSNNHQSFFRYDDALEGFSYQSPTETGNFSSTVLSFPTAFVDDDENFDSEIWTQLLQNRWVISSRLNEQTYNNEEVNPETGYYSGWGGTSQDVTIPAFISAYLGEDASTVNLDVMKTKVAPNWRVTYDGLSKIPSLKKKFRRFNLSHTYRSTMSTSYTTNLQYEEINGLPSAIDNGPEGNYISQRQFNTVSISEQLSPLVGLDMTIKTASDNEPQLKFEINRDRNVSFGLANYQVTETKSKGMVVGVGYKFANVRNPFMKTYGKLPIKMLKETDLLLRLDLNIRDNSTIIRKMEEEQNQVTAGQKLVSIKFSSDLEVSDKVTLRAYYDQQLTSPKISTSFATSNINSGFAIRFNLNQ